MFQPEILICGYGAAGRAVVKAFQKVGLPRNAISIVERSSHRAEDARRSGFISVRGDATDLARLRIAGAAIATEIVICVNDEESAAATVSIRNAAAEALVTAVLDRPSQRAAVLSSGAHSVLVLSEIAGKLLAESAFTALGNKT